MSQTALRRVGIRLLHDPGFLARLHEDPQAALAGIDLSSREVAWLLTVPPAAWRTDPDRPARVLAALAEEFPASCALAPDRARAFFGSAEFHAAVQERGSLALAFGSFMGAHADARVAAVAVLERVIAAVRRAPGTVAPAVPGTRRLTSHARVVRVPDGASALLGAVRAGNEPPPLGRDTEDVLVLRVRQSTEVTIERLDPELAILLRHAESAVSENTLVELACELGATPADARRLLADLVRDGILG